MASQNGLWQRWLHKMASGRDGFTKWPLAEMASQNGLWQRWLHKMASGRDGFTKWPLLPGGGQVSERNSASVFEVGDDNDAQREFKRKQNVQLHNTDPPPQHLTVSRHFINWTTYSQHPHYFLITINSFNRFHLLLKPINLLYMSHVTVINQRIICFFFKKIPTNELGCMNVIFISWQPYICFEHCCGLLQGGENKKTSSVSIQWLYISGCSLTLSRRVRSKITKCRHQTTVRNRAIPG